ARGQVVFSCVVSSMILVFVSIGSDGAQGEKVPDFPKKQAIGFQINRLPVSLCRHSWGSAFPLFSKSWRPHGC
ncbi:MAG: hypothetical protein RR426_09325, partial [Oscillospiraceae bacterium]